MKRIKAPRFRFRRADRKRQHYTRKNDLRLYSARALKGARFQSLEG